MENIRRQLRNKNTRRINIKKRRKVTKIIRRKIKVWNVKKMVLKMRKKQKCHFYGIRA
jgi:hypothetical protein